MRQNDEPEREHLGVTNERDSKMALETGVGGWDLKTLSQQGLWRLWLGKADEGRGVSARIRFSNSTAGHHSDAGLTGIRSRRVQAHDRSSHSIQSRSKNAFAT